MAAQQMKQGEVATIFCPGDLDKGGAFSQYSDYGSNWVTPNTDITYEVEMKECGLDPHSFHYVPPADDFKRGEPLR